MNVAREMIGCTPEGIEVERYTLTNSAGACVTVMTYGATLTGVTVPDRAGTLKNVTLWLPRLEDYLAGHPFLGSIAGRYANRIAGARFTLDGVEYQLAANNGPNHLHGGKKGFDKAVWLAAPSTAGDEACVTFSHTSPDGDEGYPGELKVKVTYAFSEGNELRMEYEAETDRATYLNLTNHAYWNLAGAGSGNVLDHILTLNADRYLPADETLIPTGELRPVAGTPMDFTEPMTIGSRIDQVGSGYDHCYVLNKPGQPGPSLAARVLEPRGGRVMEVYTTQPGVQLYTANFLDGHLRGDGAAYASHHGFCLETQHFPDSPHRPEFPSTLLRPGETFHQVTLHKFSVQE